MEQEQTLDTDELLVKYLTGTANAGERDKALAWIRKTDENKKYFDQLRDVYETSKLAQPQSDYNSEVSWQRVKARYYKKRFTTLEKENSESKRFFIQETLKYAAIITVVVALGIIGFKFLSKVPEGRNVAWNEVEAPFGSRTVVNLADGSKVWLNAGSKLKYAADFGKKNRDVFLTGEAYFDVEKNPDMQFVVKTTHINVKVFGTEFNIKAYPEENTIQTTLVEGSIKIEGASEENKGKEIELKPNQLITYIKDLHTFENDPNEKDHLKTIEKTAEPDEKHMVLVPKVNPVVFTSWKDSKWYIEGEPLTSLVVKLERRYNVKFNYNAESLVSYKFTGTLKDETLEQVLSVIKISAPIEYKIQENTVYLFENKSYKKSYDELLINR